ncbi:MAG: PASTA domain-containing protein [Saprospiraceae bacterium]|nr:PASTA domain-containing protein [Saprospiraceae bacterium]
MDRKAEGFKLSDLPAFFKSRLLLHTLVRFLLVLAILWMLHAIALRIYTHHGQRLRMPNYAGVSLDKAQVHAKGRDFKLVVNDSLFVKGKPGGLILSQVPAKGSLVKEGRTVYLTLTRHRPDQFLSGDLPVLYGKRFDFKSRELFNRFEIVSRIVRMDYDPGPEQHILQVHYKGTPLADAERKEDNIPIFLGDTLDFVVSTQEGGHVEIPDLLCNTMAEAQFLLATYKLALDQWESDDALEEPESAFVVSQQPAAGERVALGTVVKLKLQREKPDFCE